MQKTNYWKLLLSGVLVLLAIIAAVARKTPYSLLILPGMLLGFHGDLCLAKTSITQKLYREPFAVGAVSFLIGHLFYIAAFASAMPSVPAAQLWGAIAVYCAAAFILWVVVMLRSKEAAANRLMLLIYALVVGIMAAFAFALGVARGGAFYLAALGGLLFMVSDGMIAACDFAGILVPRKDTWIWATYAPAQLFIILIGFFA